MPPSRKPSLSSLEDKPTVVVEEIEHSQEPSGSKKPTVAHGDAALAILGTSEAPIEVTPEQDAAVLRKVDKWLLPVSPLKPPYYGSISMFGLINEYQVMLMVYFLQQLDKSEQILLPELNVLMFFFVDPPCRMLRFSE